MITIDDVRIMLNEYFKRYKLKVYQSEIFPERIVLYGTTFWEFSLNDCITKDEAQEQILDNLLVVCLQMKDLFTGMMDDIVRLKQQQKHINIRLKNDNSRRN